MQAYAWSEGEVQVTACVDKIQRPIDEYKET